MKAASPVVEHLDRACRVASSTRPAHPPASRPPPQLAPNTHPPVRFAVVPAAGRGLRLDRPATPKPLVDVDGQPMLFRLLRQLRRAGVERIVVVTGFDAERIRAALSLQPELSRSVTLVHNKGWEKGLAHSLAAARHDVYGEFVVAMPDHVYADDAITTAVRSAPLECAGRVFVSDAGVQVFDPTSAVKVRHEQGRALALGRELAPPPAHSAALSPELSPALSVDTGLFRFDVTIFDTLREALMEPGEVDLGDALQPLIQRSDLEVQSSSYAFDDVDTPSALVHAEMRLRRERRQARIARAHAPALRPLVMESYPYVVEQRRETRVVVGRGFVEDPRRLDLIRPESASSPLFVFTDETVAALYGRAFRDRLQAQGYEAHLIVLPDGEESKTLMSYAFLVERVLRKGVDEQSVFISLGGGVVSNVCGFVASTIYRGLHLIHLPTTLMAQCDASVSHKQGINGYQGKNMVGSYYSPQLVAIDVQTLTTLPERLLRDGMAEILKHALCQDARYVEQLLAHRGPLLDLDFLEEMIRHNVRLKCALVREDPSELREAILLQYGHTVGHPVEHLSGYTLFHGESVAVGMCVAARVSALLGGAGHELVQLHEELVRHFQLPTHLPKGLSPDDVVASMRFNKRYLVEGTRMALLRGVGELWRVGGEFAIPVSDRVLHEALTQAMEARP